MVSLKFKKYYPYLFVAFLLLGLLYISPILNVLAHGGDLSLIHSCVKNGSGTLHIVGANDSCGQGESPLDWPSTSASLPTVFAKVTSAQTPITCNTSDTDIPSATFIIPANALSTNKGVKMNLEVKTTQVGAADNPVLKLKWAGTTVFDSGSSVP